MQDWINLIQQAKNQGLSIDDIKEFIEEERGMNDIEKLEVIKNKDMFEYYRINPHYIDTDEVRWLVEQTEQYLKLKEEGHVIVPLTNYNNDSELILSQKMRIKELDGGINEAKAMLYDKDKRIEELEEHIKMIHSMIADDRLNDEETIIAIKSSEFLLGDTYE